MTAPIADGPPGVHIGLTAEEGETMDSTVEIASSILGVGGAALAVRDLDPVLRFYREVVGLELLSRREDGASLGAGGVPLLELLHRPLTLPHDPAAAGLFHIAFLLPSRVDLGRWLAHAARLGQRLDGAADHLVSEAVYLHDPGGNGVEIYADRPRSTWRWTGRQVVMANDRLDMIGLRALASMPDVPPWDGAPAGTKIGHVHLQVGDVEEATAFYAGELGLDVTRRGPSAVFLSAGGYHHHLAANTWNSAGAGPRDPRRAGLASLTLLTAKPQAGLNDPWNTRIDFGVSSS